MIKDILISNIDKIHTTKLGIYRICKNLGYDVTNDILIYIKNIILDSKSAVLKKGKNYYCYLDKIVITINSYSFTVITAHKERR